MKILNMTMIAAAAIGFAQVSQADVCELVSHAQAQQALEMILHSKTLTEQCYNCQDSSAHIVQIANARIVSSGSGDDSSVQITDGSGKTKTLDLAYTSIPDSLGGSINIGDELGCSARPDQSDLQ